MIPVSLPDVIENSLVVFNDQFRIRNIKLQKEYATDLPTILGEEKKLEQVFINLLDNSRDALEEKGNGRIILKAQFVAGMNGSSHIEISIMDDGCGIPFSIQEKIFDPLFTTKSIGKRIGLGLSISYEIIQEHRREIYMSSIEGRGSIFEVILPVLNN